MVEYSSGLISIFVVFVFGGPVFTGSISEKNFMLVVLVYISSLRTTYTGRAL